MRKWIDLIEAELLPWGHGNAGCWILPSGEVLPCDYEADEHHADIAFQHFDLPADQDPDEMDEINDVAFREGWIRIRMTATDFMVQCDPTKISQKAVAVIPSYNDGHIRFMLSCVGQNEVFTSIGQMLSHLRSVSRKASGDVITEDSSSLEISFAKLEDIFRKKHHIDLRDVYRSAKTGKPYFNFWHFCIKWQKENGDNMIMPISRDIIPPKTVFSEKRKEEIFTRLEKLAREEGHTGDLPPVFYETISDMIRKQEQESEGVTKIVEIILKDFKGPILLNLNWRD